MKKKLIIAALVAATVLLSFGPGVWGYIENRERLSEERLWEYSEQEKSVMTAEKFARLYSQALITSNMNIVQSSDEETFSEEAVRTDVLKILDDFFRSDNEVYEAVKKATEEPIKFYQKTDLLYMEENTLIALGIVNVNYVGSEYFLDIFYEEKTGVITQLYYIQHKKIDKAESEDILENELFLDAVYDAERNYYGDRLGLSENYYYFVPSVSSAEVYVNLGIRQGVEKEYTEVIQ